MNARSIKIEAFGDAGKGETLKPKLRLCGRWLERAGFTPGARVSVCNPEPGRLVIVNAPGMGQMAGADFSLLIDRMDSALARADAIARADITEVTK